MRFRVLAVAAAGLAVAVFLVFRIGLAPVLHATVHVGAAGFAVIVLFQLMLNPVLAAGWAAVAPARAAPFSTLMIGRQIRDSVGDVLPFSQLGGIVAGARAASLRGFAAASAFASAIADVTTELMSQILYVAFGAAYLLLETRLASPSRLATGLLFGTVLMIPGIGVFVFLQTRGSRLAESLAKRFFPAGVRHAAAFHRAVGEIYRAPARVAASAAIHLAGWFASGAGTWIIFRLMGGHIGFLAAAAMEALLGGIRSAFVFVPSALGVQEAGYAALAPLFGLPPEAGIAAALLKRAREIVIGVPVLLAWQAMEGRHALQRADDLPEG